jgi:hypothetical protein
LCRFEKVLSQRRENIDQHNLFIQHSRAMPAAGREVQHIARLSNSFLVAYNEAHTASLYYRDLFVRMLVGRRVHVGLKAQAANHELVSDDHLPLDPFADALDGYVIPTAVLRSAIQD